MGRGRGDSGAPIERAAKPKASVICSNDLPHAHLELVSTRGAGHLLLGVGGGGWGWGVEHFYAVLRAPAHANTSAGS